ncbi:MAG TPA: porin family protein [Cyclobacteriaceae bacterium]
MKKHTLILIFVALVGTLSAQSKLAIQVSPAISLNRNELISDSLNVDTDGIGGRFMLGLVWDTPISDNYFFSSGIYYTPKRVAFGISSEDNQNNLVNESYNLQYIQIPISLKLFTNELVTDLRPYVHLGSLFDVKVHDEPAEEDFNAISGIKPFDVSLMIGIGIEYRLGVNTVLYSSLVYNRGMLNVIDGSSINDFSVKNDLLYLGFGVKF